MFSFLFVSCNFLKKFPFHFFWIHWLFRRVLLNFYVFTNFPVFLLLLISSIMPLWLEKIFFLQFTRIVLLSNIWSVLENDSYALEKNFYFAFVELHVLYMSVRFIVLGCCLNLLISYQLSMSDLSIVENWALKSPTILLLHCISALVVKFWLYNI